MRKGFYIIPPHYTAHGGVNNSSKIMENVIFTIYEGLYFRVKLCRERAAKPPYY